MIFSAHPFCILSVSLQRFTAHSQLQRTAVHYILMREEWSLQLIAVQHNAPHILVVAAVVVVLFVLVMLVLALVAVLSLLPLLLLLPPQAANSKLATSTIDKAFHFPVCE